MIKTTPCPHCGNGNDTHACATDPGSTPSPGDVSLCSACRQLSVFADGMGYLYLRKPTADEQAELDADDTIQGILRDFGDTTDLDGFARALWARIHNHAHE